MSGVKTSFFDAESQIPLVVEPATADFEPAGWITEHRGWLEQSLDRHGAILFRNFGLSEVSGFERAVAAICPSLLNYFEGTSPRKMLGRAVYTSTEYPAEYVVSLHNEMSYAHKWPGKIFFFCHTAPQQGGQTPIADSRKVFELIDPQVRGKFIEKGVKYVRNLHGGNGPGLAWQTVFETDDRAKVEQYCQEGDIDLCWRPDGGLRTSQVRPAVARHPKTGELLWFNQAHNFHPSDLGEEEAEDLLAIFDEEDLPNNACYGDGSPFETAALAAVRSAYAGATRVFPWQAGDLLMLDNMMVAHGRMPFSGPRKILVAMAEPIDHTQLR